MRAGILGAFRLGEDAAVEFKDLIGAQHHRIAGITHPPRLGFGKRVGNGDLLHLYQSLGHRITSLGDGWRAAILAHDVRLVRRTALSLVAAFTTRHGGLAVTLLGTSPPIPSDPT